MNKISRREAITGILATGATVLSLSETGFAQQTDEVLPLAFRGEHKPKPLPFDATKLTGISEKLITSHWQNNYSGAVSALNVVEKRLAQLVKEKDAPAYLYGNLKREELIRTGSIVLHDHYFANLGGNGKAGGIALKVIEQWWGDYGAWETEFRKTGQALGGGSGWTILAFNFHTKQLHNYWAADHAHNAPFSVPILVLDMYEHAYQMDYGAAAAKYIDAFMQNVNWEEVNRRVEKAMKMSG
jgi:superoxide dismutase, Fe-Mn family